MKFDLGWLRDLVDPAADADTIAQRLTACGFLVELRERDADGEVWEVEVTTNRPDAMNHRGLARELAVATGAVLRPLSVELTEDAEPAAAVFYVAYTMWWGFAIYYIFDGVGLSMSKAKH